MELISCEDFSRSAKYLLDAIADISNRPDRAGPASVLTLWLSTGKERENLELGSEHHIPLPVWAAPDFILGLSHNVQTLEKTGLKYLKQNVKGMSRNSQIPK